MASPTPHPSELIAPLTTWYVRRMVILLAMFGFFTAYFAYDWRVGYPKKAVIYQEYLSYTERGEEGMREWARVSQEKGYSYEDTKKLMPMKVDDGKIAQQFWGMVVCGVATLWIGISFARSFGTRTALSGGQLHLPGGPPINMADIVRVDTRKWLSKGLAKITYKSGGSEKSAVLDGLKYGGFKGEKPYVPDAILDYVVKHFQGELIELEETPADGTTGADAENSGPSGEKQG